MLNHTDTTTREPCEKLLNNVILHFQHPQPCSSSLASSPRTCPVFLLQNIFKTLRVQVSKGFDQRMLK